MTSRRSDDLAYTLLSNASATGNAVQIRGGEYMFMADGNIGGSTLSLQVQMPNNNWVDVQVFTGSVVRFTVLPANQTAIDMPMGNVRCALTGGTPTGIFAYLIGLG